MGMPLPHDLDWYLARCWGKAAPEVPGGHHPVLLHMLDVAAVAMEILRLPTSARTNETLCHAGEEPLSLGAIALLVACHDLGKISPGFQAKVPALSERLRPHGVPFPPRPETDHSRLGYLELPALLQGLGADFDAAFDAAAAVCAHHGGAPREMEPSTAKDGGPIWRTLRARSVAVLRESLQVTDLAALREVSDPWRARLAGLTSVADWLGSSVDFFPYLPDRSPDAAYVVDARQRARHALEAIGWSQWEGLGSPLGFAGLFPGWTPSPLQDAAGELAEEAASPGLLIVEAPTGSGKTEAALVVAERWLADHGLSGVYVALPTQATSNQMVGRVTDFLERRVPGARVNLHLVHGHSSLDSTYRQLRLRSVGEPGEASPSVVADEWFQPRRRTLLSPFAVGTVDQILMAALQSRHFFVRLHALADKVVIIDEVHAYDTFMSRILDRLLEWLRALGAGVVLLSATLPRARREALLQAWGGPIETDGAPSYPRLTLASPGLTQITVAARRRREVHLVHLAADTAGTASWLADRLAQGGCGAWVCNTVRGAQEAHAALRAQGWRPEELTLFHARFPIEDRLARERTVLEAFSKDGQRPHRHIVVATQVIEQSLDLDFDLMVTEVAPVDLLLQRAGRVHRHARDARPPGLERPTLVLQEPAADPASLDFGASSHVYAEHILLRTWAALRDRDHWTTPDDLDPLIAAVYDPGGEPPDDLRVQWERSEASLKRELERAWYKPEDTLAPRPSPHDSVFERTRHALRDSADGGPSSSMTARTRDIDDSATLICLGPLRDDGTASLAPANTTDRIRLDQRPGHRELAHLIRRSVSISHRGWIAHLRRHARLPSAWRRTSALRGALVVHFDDTGQAQPGGRPLTLDPDLGLLLTSSSEQTA